MGEKCAGTEKTILSRQWNKWYLGTLEGWNGRWIDRGQQMLEASGSVWIVEMHNVIRSPESGDIQIEIRVYYQQELSMIRIAGGKADLYKK